MEVLRAGKLHSYVGPDQFLYVRNWVRPNGVEYYKCRKKTCSGRAVVKNNEFRSTAAHNHLVDLEQVQRLKFKHKLQQRAAEEPISISEIYKQEASMIEGMTVQKFKSINKTMYRARAVELPPPPKTITELGASLSDDKWKEKLVYAYGEEKEEFFKAHLESEDGSTQIVFMSPTFEDFARSGAPLRLHMDAAFKLKPACGEGSQYVVIHMYIGTISYPFVHMFTCTKSYFAYVTLMKYMRQLIPNINVEIFVSNDQESVEAAYTVFPKAVKSYYQQEEKDSKKEKDLTDLELYNKELTKQVGRPKPGIWRFIEVLKDIDYNKMSDYYRLRNKRVPNRYPKKFKDAEVQVDNCPKNVVKVNAICQTIPPTNIKEYFTEFQPDLSTTFKRTNNFSKAIGTSPIVDNKYFNLPHSIDRSITPMFSPPKKRNKSHTVIIKRSKHYNDENISPTKDTTDEIIPLTLDDSSEREDNLQLEVLLDPNDFPNRIIPSNVESAATEALKILKALKREKSDKNPINKKVIILNPKSLLNNSKNKIVKITKMKPSKSLEDRRKDYEVVGVKNEDSQMSGGSGDSRFLEVRGENSRIIKCEVGESQMEEDDSTMMDMAYEDGHAIVGKSEDSRLIEMQDEEEDEIGMNESINYKDDEMVVCETIELKNDEGGHIINEIIEESEHHEIVENNSMPILSSDHVYPT